jgi:hypothetical protein
MKKTLVTTYASTLELPQLSKPVPLTFSNRKIMKRAEELSSIQLRPTEEMVRQLNRIGQEYPFCVYHKVKANDPL